MGINKDAWGWTSFTVSSNGFGEGNTYNGSGTRIIYCSPSGNNLNDGSFASPVLSPKVGLSMLRNGFPDWLLMMKTGVWIDLSIGNIQGIGGLDLNNRMLISCYDPNAAHNPPVPNPYTGGARPLFKLSSAWGESAMGCIGGGPGFCNYLAFAGLSFLAYKRDPSSVDFSLTEADHLQTSMGTSFTQDGYLIEDVSVAFFNEGISQGNITQYQFINNFVVRRSQILSGYQTSSATGGGTGLACGGGGSVNAIFEENVIDHNEWVDDPRITWPQAQPSGFSHNFYYQNFQILGDPASIGTPPTVSGNIFSNEPSAPQFRCGGQINNNLFVLNPFNLPIGLNTKIVSDNYLTNLTNNVFINGAQNVADSCEAVNVAKPDFDNNNFGRINTNTNLILNCPRTTSARGAVFDSGTHDSTFAGFYVYNWGIANASFALSYSIGSINGTTITNKGAGYTDLSFSISSAAASTDGQNYIVVSLSAPTSDIANVGEVMYRDGAGVLHGPVSATPLDSQHVVLFGTTFSSTFTGTLYIPYYQVSLTGGSGNGAIADLFSVNGSIEALNFIGSDNAWVGEVRDDRGAGYSVSNSLSATPGSAIANRITTGGFSNGTGSGLIINVDSLCINTIGANFIDPTGTNSNNWSDPNRTVASYYATLPGATPNSTFTGSITGGVLTVTSSVTGNPLSVADAITWPGQTKADYIKSFGTGSGGTGTYNLASKDNSIQAIASSSAMNGFTDQQFINLARTNNKSVLGAAPGWDVTLTASAVNDYLRAGLDININIVTLYLPTAQCWT